MVETAVKLGPRRLPAPRQRRRGRIVLRPLCRAEKVKAYQREYRRKRYATDPEFRAARAPDRARYLSDPEVRRARNAKRVAYERERRRSDPEYREKALGKIAAYQRKRYAIDAAYREKRRRWNKANRARAKAKAVPE
jgi:hypothetical protein